MSKLMRLGVALVLSGVTSSVLEWWFYGSRLDENGVLQESFFLPLAFILVFLGGGLIVVSAGWSFLSRARRQEN